MGSLPSASLSAGVVWMEGQFRETATHWSESLMKGRPRIPYRDLFPAVVRWTVASRSCILAIASDEAGTEVRASDLAVVDGEWKL
ncbi:hypothetical protein HPP92_028742 [Vanilla planifolia]|uniref:Uncharacterized protein n=1 Tax=Vanilla planifolia TaxID=51239 RepID=A0A835P6B4_VANPL|nr:hypothetical protein HPP92_028742 [Vanilla planifolia]KAG0446653.1 hypothetical protein HPP92_028731 [Vanilla planifolia]